MPEKGWSNHLKDTWLVWLFIQLLKLEKLVVQDSIIELLSGRF